MRMTEGNVSQLPAALPTCVGKIYECFTTLRFLNPFRCSLRSTINIGNMLLPIVTISILVLGAPAVWADVSPDQITCERPTGPTIELGQAKLFFEHNATDEDTGVHGAFDTSSFAELCVYNPNGRQILAVKPQKKLLKLTMGGIFFESREPPNEEVSLESLMADFPEGLYTIRGVSIDGTGLSGAATFTHVIAAAPVIVFPQDEELVSPTNLTIQWSVLSDH